MSAGTTCRLTAVFLALVAIVAIIGLASAEEFTDVPRWHWAWAYVQGVRDASITTGYGDGTYQPSVIVARDQMAVFIARAMCDGDANVPDGPDTASFADVPNTGFGPDGTDPFWAYKYVEYAVSHHVTAGFDDGLYHPDWDVTRGQMAAFMARAMCGGEEYVPTPSGTPRFPDVTDTENSWCYKHVEYIAGEGVTLGYPDGLYHPEIACARDQMAAYLCRAFDLPMPPQPYNITEYFPLTEGSSWVYETNDGMRTRTISGTQQAWGQTYARMVSDYGSVDLWRAAPEALYLGGLDYGDSGTLTFDPAYQIANGLGIGQIVNEQESTAYAGSSPAGTAWFDYYFVDVEDVTVPAGTFENCMKLRIQFQLMAEQDQQCYIWVAKGVGIVKMDSGDFGGEQWEVLVSANVGGHTYPTNAGPFRFSDYRPLEMGSTWVYTGSGGTTVDQIVGVAKVNDIEAAQLDTGPAEITPACSYYAVLDGALCYVGMREAGGSPVLTFSPPIALPETASVGDYGSATTQVYSDGSPVGQATFDWAVVGAGPLAVEAGEFENCMKLRTAITDPSSETSESYTWYALGVGPIKEDARPFGGTDWRTLLSASVSGVEYPVAGQSFNITDYVDLTVGNVWSYDNGYYTVTYAIPYLSYHDGYDWACVDDRGGSGGIEHLLRVDYDGLHYLGTTGTEVRYDPPLLIQNGLAPGDGGEEVSAYSESGIDEGDATFEYTFEGIQAASTDAGLFPDCMKVTYSLRVPWMPTGASQTGTRWFSRGLGAVLSVSSSTSSPEEVWTELLTSASIAGVNYPPADTAFTVTDYLPVAMDNRWATMAQGERWYGASTVIVDGTQFLSGLPIADTVYKLSRYDAAGYQGSDLIAIRTDGIGIYGHTDPVDGPMVVNPPLLIPNGAKVGDSGSGSATMHVWAGDHWQAMGTVNGFWELVAAGPITTSAGHFRDCILIRWGVDVPGMGEMVNYSWHARGVGVVKWCEADDSDWEEMMGATIGGVTIPADLPPNTPVSASIPQGASFGFDFSAGASTALPDDQDLSYVYVSAQDAYVMSFDPNGVSRTIGQGQYDFESIRAYSTFLPPDWYLRGQAWLHDCWVLGIGWDAIEGTTVVKTREGNYALVHITSATPTELGIEYVYPYGFFE
jgi:hypothetical protein